MRYPWNNDRCDTRITRLDPSVIVNPVNRDSDAAIIERYHRAVAENLRRREDKKAEVVSIFHRKQAWID